MRKHAPWYLKGVRGNATVPSMINQTETAEQMTSIINGVAEELMEREAASSAI